MDLVLFIFEKDMVQVSKVSLFLFSSDQQGATVLSDCIDTRINNA